MTTARTGFSLAAAAAIAAVSILTPATQAVAQSGDEKVHCYGVNSCKGTSDCKSAKHECKGQNDCKGQGFKEISAKQCATEGGSLTEPK